MFPVPRGSRGRDGDELTGVFVFSDQNGAGSSEVDGHYGYYLTVGYPYVVACTSGAPSKQLR